MPPSSTYNVSALWIPVAVVARLPFFGDGRDHIVGEGKISVDANIPVNRPRRAIRSQQACKRACVRVFAVAVAVEVAVVVVVAVAVAVAYESKCRFTPSKEFSAVESHSDCVRILSIYKNIYFMYNKIPIFLPSCAGRACAPNKVNGCWV